MFEKRVGKGLVCVALAAATSFAACSDDGGSDPGSSAGTAGSGGAGGSDASGGKGGSSGKGGSTASGGKGGSSGGKGGSSGGKGGTSSSGGEAGSASEAGAGGDATTGGTGGEGGGDGDEVVIPSSIREWLTKLSPLPEVPPDPTNAFADDPDAAELGQMLFFDKKFSGQLTVASDLGEVGDAGKVSCASCHSSEYLDDDRSNPQTVSIGTGVHTRNSPTLINASFYQWTN